MQTPPSQLDGTTQLGDLGSGKSGQDRFRGFPWWLVALFVVIIGFGVVIATDAKYQKAFLFIIGGITIQPDGSMDATGLSLTIIITVVGFAIAFFIGLLVGLGRVSNNIILSNIATFYVEFIRGIPMLVLIFTIAFVAVPAVVTVFNQLGAWLTGLGIPNGLADLKNDNVSFLLRGIIAVAITYGAYLAEVFRAGIQSISPGQMEAARSLGMTYGQSMRYVVLPQAIRNVFPALGNDFISMLKDSSLLSVLAVREITQLSRIYASSSFQFGQAYTSLSVLYLTMTVLLSLVLRFLERRMQSHD